MVSWLMVDSRLDYIKLSTVGTGEYVIDKCCDVLEMMMVGQ